MTNVVLALTTLPEDFDAVSLARALVEERVAACVSILPAVRSVYRWQGAVESATEQQLLIKTSADRVDALWTALRARHPYDTPEFLVLAVDGGNEEYLAWVLGAGC